METRHGSHSSSEEKRETIKGKRDIGENPAKRDYSDSHETAVRNGIIFLEDVRAAKALREPERIVSFPSESFNPPIQDEESPKEEQAPSEKSHIKRAFKRFGKIVFPEGNRFSVFGNTKKPF